MVAVRQMQPICRQTCCWTWLRRLTSMTRNNRTSFQLLISVTSFTISVSTDFQSVKSTLSWASATPSLRNETASTLPFASMSSPTAGSRGMAARRKRRSAGAYLIRRIGQWSPSRTSRRLSVNISPTCQMRTSKILWGRSTRKIRETFLQRTSQSFICPDWMMCAISYRIYSNF